VPDTIGLLKLTRYRHVKAKYLSLGNLQRLGLAKALMHKPKVLILDEPVNGLDPAGIVEIRELLSRLAEEGATILMSSHLLTEIARIADIIGIIHHGVLISELKSESLHMQLQRKLIIETDDPEKTQLVLERLNTRPVMKAPGEWEILVDNSSLPSEIVASALVNEGIGLRKLNPWEEDLESFFLRIIHGKDQ
jgi:ABC-2 type transport system ATP-binding protein